MMAAGGQEALRTPEPNHVAPHRRQPVGGGVFTGPQFVSLDVSRYPAVFWQQWLNGCSGRLEWNEQARRDRVLKPREAEVFVEPSGILILRIDDGRAQAYHRFTDRADPDQGVN